MANATSWERNRFWIRLRGRRTWSSMSGERAMRSHEERPGPGVRSNSGCTSWNDGTRGRADGAAGAAGSFGDWNDGAARKRLLQLIEAQGLEDPWARSQRRRLSALLFT